MSGIGQTQIRMVQHGPRIGQTTIRPTTPQQIVRTATPTMRPLTTIRGQTTIVQTQTNNQQVPALHPVSGTTIISSGTAQVCFDTLSSLFLILFIYFFTIISSIAFNLLDYY